jgi:DNA polymerase-3 subunit gamma/tau
VYVSLYRRYRPQRFSEVIGQKAAVGVVMRAIETNSVSHAYLFSGPRGCGKTTVARLFAKAVNCPQRQGAEPCNQCDTCRSIVEGSCLDVIEIDGASNNGVDEIRDLKEHVALATFTCPYKVYIIDEVHMLSAGAFNALLKTLEEPPERVIFILATTAPHKVPVTIRSRCQHIPFHGIPPEQIVERLLQVIDAEKISAEDEALWEIARNSDGGMRDALSLLEQAIAFSGNRITREALDKLLGGGSSSSIRKWISSCRLEPENALPTLEGLFRSGAVPERFVSVFFTCIRNLWLVKRWGPSVLNGLSLSEEERHWLEQEQSFLSEPHLERLMAQAASLLPQIRRGLSNDVLCGLLVSWVMKRDAASATLPQEKREGLPQSAEPRRLPDRTEAETPGSERKTKEKSASLPDVSPAHSSPTSSLPDVSPASAEGAAASDKSEPQPSKGKAPDVTGFVPRNGNLAEILAQKLPSQPQNAMPLRLADILWESEQKQLSVIFDAEDNLSFEGIRTQRSAHDLREMLKPLDCDVESVVFYCGDQSERFGVAQDFPAPQPSQHDSAPAASPANRGVEKTAHGASEEKNAPGAKSALPSKRVEASDEKGQSLSEYLRGFMDGELLYCRPNEKPEETDEEEV